MGEQSVRYVISILARDEVGIIADVTGALYALGANLEALSQTVVGQWFTMIVAASLPDGTTAADVRAAAECGGRFASQVLAAEAGSRPAHPAGDPFVVTVIGQDRPGIVCRLTRSFADRGINIEDVWNEVCEGQFIVIFRVTVPGAVDTKDLRYELEQAAEGLGVSVRLQHQDIFTATNTLSLREAR